MRRKGAARIMNTKLEVIGGMAPTSQSWFTRVKRGSLGTRGRLLVFLNCLLALMLLVPGSLISENRAETPKELTKEERDQLEKRALKLHRQASQLYQQGKFVEATKTQK